MLCEVIIFNRFLIFHPYSEGGGLVTPEMSRVRDGVHKTLFLFFLRARELPGVESWNRFLDFS